jgi:hypothetical protein
VYRGAGVVNKEELTAACGPALGTNGQGFAFFAPRSLAIRLMI